MRQDCEYRIKSTAYIRRQLFVRRDYAPRVTGVNRWVRISPVHCLGWAGKDHADVTVFWAFHVLYFLIVLISDMTMFSGSLTIILLKSLSQRFEIPELA